MARESKRTRDERRFGKAERLIDMAHSNQWRLPSYANGVSGDKDIMKSLVEYKRAFLEILSSSKLVVAENVSEYFYAQNPKEVWDYEQDFPSILPPFREMFVEFCRPSRIFSEGKTVSTAGFPDRWGWLFEIDSREDLVAKATAEGQQAIMLRDLASQLDMLYPLIDKEAIKAVRNDPIGMKTLGDRERTFLALGAQYLSMKRGDPVMESMPTDATWFVKGMLVIAEHEFVSSMGTVTFALRSDGRMIGYPVYGIIGGHLTDPEVTTAIRNSLNSMMMPAAMTLSFMHCKNVAIDSTDPDRAINRERKKRGLRPFVRYHTINIEPMKKIIRAEGGVETNGLKKALHIVRGHFATYTEERPLFGKVAGTFWMPAHVRGSIKEGIVSSDYNVHAPKTKTED